MSNEKAKGAAKRRGALSRERVCRKAIQLADKHGLEAVSMRRLARALGVEAMSLYHHVANKDEVLNGMVDLVAGEIAVPVVGGDWRAAMRERALSAHAVFLRHRWAPGLFVARVNVGPAMLRLVDATLGCLHTAGFSYELADAAWNALDSHLYGFTLQELNFPIAAEDYGAAAREFLPMLSVESHPHLRALAERVGAGEHSGRPDFEFGLRLVLDGLERKRVKGEG